LFYIDLDNGPVTATIFDSDDAVIDTVTISPGDPGTGNGQSTEFFLSGEGITSLLVDAPEGDGVGYALDFVSFTRPCEGDACGQQITLSQESAPGAGDFDSNTLGTLLPFPTTISPAEFYAYNVPEGDSWNGSALTPVADRSHLLMGQTLDGLTLFVVHDRAVPNDPDGGRAETIVEIVNDPDGAERTVEDDPAQGDVFIGEPGDATFTATQQWDTCCTDGYAITGLDDLSTTFMQFADTDDNASTPAIDGLSEWVAYSADGETIALAFEEGRRIRLKIGSSVGCPEDIANRDNTVNVADLLALLSVWGPCADCPADFNNSGAVDVADLLQLHAAWGPCS